MNPLLEYLKTQKPELAEVITVIDAMQSVDETEPNNQNEQDTIDTEGVDIDQVNSKIEGNNTTELLRVKRANRILNEELEFQDYLIENLARALGACNQCFGLDEVCDNCRGLGTSGYFIPEIKPYKKVIAPAVAKMNLHFKTKINY